MRKSRQDNESPLAIKEWGLKYHHLGIPTTRRLPDEPYLEKFKFYVSGFETSPFGIEWMRFEKDSPIDKIIQEIPHVALKLMIWIKNWLCIILISLFIQMHLRKKCELL